MARIQGVDLPPNKRIEIALTYIYGIGPSNSKVVLKMAEVDPNTKVKDLSEVQIQKISKVISDNFKVEGELKKEISENIKRLQDIGCYRGIRHKKGLPVRGQRTHTNARTRKGPRRQAIAGKKKATKK
jgi:small subunit ribosomal protein S13